MDRRSAEKDRVAVSRRMRDELRRERAAGAGLVVDKNRTEACLHLVGPRPADNVEHAAWRKRQYEADRTIRIAPPRPNARRPRARRHLPRQQKIPGVPMS
jgi:hypothetical protein